MSHASRRCLKTFGAFALCAGLFLTGCRQSPEPHAYISVAHEVAPDPPRVGKATITLRVADASGTALERRACEP